MASWQAKHRDPLFDQSTQAALERRGKELLGAGLVVLGVLIAMMLISYSPDDPSFMSATAGSTESWPMRRTIWAGPAPISPRRCS